MSRLDLPIRAAKETAERYGVVTDRCEILQDGNTLVLRLSESLVARVVTDRDGPRQGDGWFARENAVAEHLARAGAPVEEAVGAAGWPQSTGRLFSASRLSRLGRT